MKIRNIPFGYKYENGQKVINEKESVAVIEIFTRYLKREGVMKIANDLTERRIEYMPNEFEWNKSRVLRVVKDARYIGGKKFPPIIDKSISRFARNTVDCLHYTRILKTLGIDVYFEEQGIHSIKSDAEFYISIYGTIAQSESENISANVKWGKLQSAKEGKVAFMYKNFLGYRKGADGNPEIDEEQAETVKRIYDRFIAGDSLKQIAVKLQNEKRLSPSGRNEWSTATIRSILSNEKYKGDAIINKTFTVDCLTKEIRKNNGERPKYYVENNHPAIIDAETFGRVQEELARRIGKKK